MKKTISILQYVFAKEANPAQYYSQKELLRILQKNGLNYTKQALAKALKNYCVPQNGLCQKITQYHPYRQIPYISYNLLPLPPLCPKMQEQATHHHPPPSPEDYQALKSQIQIQQSQINELVEALNYQIDLNDLKDEFIGKLAQLVRMAPNVLPFKELRIKDIIRALANENAKERYFNLFGIFKSIFDNRKKIEDSINEGYKVAEPLLKETAELASKLPRTTNTLAITQATQSLFLDITSYQK